MASAHELRLNRRERDEGAPDIAQARVMARELKGTLEELIFGRDDCAEKLRDAQILIAELRALLRDGLSTPAAKP